MLAADFSFILHTTNPLRPRSDEAYVEVAAGLGESLASGATRGTPCRFACSKKSGSTETLAFASFSQALVLSSGGGLTWQTVDYTRIPFSWGSRAIGPSVG
jgi:phosphoglucan,water dikinase